MRDILKFAVELGRGLADTRTIGEIGLSELVTVSESQSVYETIEIMIGKNTGCVIVLAQKEPKGIFTERDVLKRVAVKDIDPQKTPVSAVMTPNFIAMAQSALIGEVLAEMHQRGFRHLPIRDDRGKLSGMVSLVDVLKFAKALDVDESIRKAWKEVEEFWESEEHYTPG
jgi:CBS domain-containing protein